MKVFNSTSEAYLDSLREVYFNADYVSAPRNQPVREKLDYTFRVLNPTSDSIITKDEKRNIVIASYTQKEKELYDSCTNSAEDFGKASKFWLNLANPDNTVNSAYGHLIWGRQSHGSDFEEHFVEDNRFPMDPNLNKVLINKPIRRTPWDWCVESLKRDKDTRQAILRFNLPEHAWMGNKDFVCTMHGIFLIRDDKLNLSVVMRSNDLVKGLVYDMPWFCSLMDKMLVELKPLYPNLTKGYYTHTVHNIHIYERDEQTVLKMINGVS